MNTISNEVATNVAIGEEYTQSGTEETVTDQYNWNGVIDVLTSEYTPEVFSYHLHRCMIRYAKYLIADENIAGNREVGIHVDILESLYNAVSGMNQEPEEDEENHNIEE